MLRIERLYEADTPRKLRLGWIVQELAVGAKHDRHLPGIYMEALDERFRVCVGLRIELLMRMAVTAQEASQPQYVAVSCRTDDNGASGASFQQSDAT